MTSPGQYGSHQYQSPETRALASITADSFDKDQAKTLIQLKNDVGYMAAYMRKMQKSIDQANENFIQQIQSFIADFITLLGGGSLTSIDFGDLQYVIQAIGALLGFQTVAGIPIPINLFTAAWNFFGIYIAPTQQFEDVINELIDAVIAIIIDAVGDIPIVGQAVEQLAAWLIEIRDALWPLVDTVFGLIDVLSGQPGSSIEDVLEGILTQLGLHIDLDFSTPQSFVDSLILLLEDLLNINFDDYLGKNSPLNADNLFNLIPSDLMAQISASNIGMAITNLIADPTFQDATNFSGGDVYIHDITQGHSGTGSAKTVADGTGAKELLSNLIPVSQDQVLSISGWAKWTSLVGTGNPIQLGITGYLPGGATVQSIVAQHTATPTTTDWTQLSGTYKVPADVESIRVRLTVSPAATAGTVWWDDLKTTKIQALLQKLIGGTNPGETLTDDVTHLFTGIVTNANGLLSKVEQSAHDALLDALGSQNLQTIEDKINSFLNGFSPLNANNINQGNIADQFVGGIGTINDNIVTRLLGLSGSGFGHTAAADALKHQSSVDIDTSARLAQLENVLTGGVSDGDDFERTSATSLGAGWLTYYQGGAGIWATPNGHDASFAVNGTNTREFLCIRNSGQIRSNTIFQRQDLVLGSNASRFYLPGVYNYCGHNDIWLRISDATTGWANVTGIRYRFGGDGSVSVCRFVNGVNLDSATALAYLPPDSIVPPGPGSNIWAEAGTPGTARYFRCGLGTSPLLFATEVGVASGADNTCLRWGHGGRAEGHLLPLPGQEKPATVHQETRKDQLT